jgi:hypothetical protein
MNLPFTIAAGARQRSHSHFRVPRDLWPYFTVSDSRLPQPGGPGPRIYIPQEQDDPVIPQILDSHFVASYDSQGYGGGIRTFLHMGLCLINHIESEIILNNIWNSVRTSQETYHVSAIKPKRLVPFRETVAVCCENHTGHINTLCEQNPEF